MSIKELYKLHGEWSKRSDTGTDEILAIGRFIEFVANKQKEKNKLKGGEKNGR